MPDILPPQSVLTEGAKFGRDFVLYIATCISPGLPLHENIRKQLDKQHGFCKMNYDHIHRYVGKTAYSKHSGF